MNNDVLGDDYTEGDAAYDLARETYKHDREVARPTNAELIEWALKEFYLCDSQDGTSATETAIWQAALDVVASCEIVAGDCGHSHPELFESRNKFLALLREARGEA